MLMNTITENIKLRPKQFIFSFIIPCLIVWIALLILKSDIVQIILFGVVMVLLNFIHFNVFVTREVLNEKLNSHIRKKNISKEKLYEITGLTKYEVTENENTYEFFVSSSRKKKYLKILENYNN